MSQIRDLLVEELSDLLHAETQLVAALPKMAEAANDRKLKENFLIHLDQTKIHVSRLEEIFGVLGEEPTPKPCKAMMGLIEESKDVMKAGKEKEVLAADLALITCAQKVEHYEISAYGTAHVLARQIEQYDVAELLRYTLGDEEAADAILTMNAKPLLQQATAEDLENEAEEMNDTPRRMHGRKKGRDMNHSAAS